MADTPPYNPNTEDDKGGRGAHSTSHENAYLYGGVRLPFVNLTFLNEQIPLLDNARRGGDGGTHRKLTNPKNPLFLISMVHEIESFIMGSNTLTLEILDPGFDYLENILLSKAREIELFGFGVSYGYQGVDQSFYRQPNTVPFIILNIDFKVEPNRGVVVTLHCVDQTANLFVGSYYDSWPETATISEVAKSVVKKFHPNIDFTIDATSQQVGELNRMEGQSAGEYIKMLLKHADPVNGVTPVYKAIVSPPTASSGKTSLAIGAHKVTTPVESYTYGRQRQGEMIAFTATMNDKSMALIGGGRVSTSSTFNLIKTVTRENLTQNDDVEISGPRRAVETPKEPTKHIESPQSPNLAKTKAKGYIAVVDLSMWEGTATVMGNTSLKPYENIYVTILKNAPTGAEVNLASANEVYWQASGVWTIKSVTNQIEAGVFITLLELYRNGGYKGKGVGGAAIPISFQTVKKIGSGVISRVLPLENEDTFNPEVWKP